MINLLPDDAKRDIQAARMNVVLLRYNIIILGTMVVLALACLAFYVILRSSQSNAVSTNQDNTTKAASYASVREQADTYRDNLAIANKIFQNSISYTDVITAITQLIPDGVILDNLSLTSTTFGSQTSFAAHAQSYDKATKLKANFQSSSLFSNVFFQSLTSSAPVKSDNPGSNNSYPVSVVLSAKLNKDAGR